MHLLRRQDLPPDAVLYVGGQQVIRVYQGHLLIWSAFTFSPRWKHLAACQGMPPELFIPEDLDEPPPPGLAELCSTCPVRLRCESYGRASESSGWWGGIPLYLGRTWQGRTTEMLAQRRRKITPEMADEIRARWHCGAASQHRLATEYGIPVSYVNEIIHGHTKVLPVTGMASLSGDQIEEIRQRYLAGGIRQKDLAAEFGVGRTTITKIIGNTQQR